MSSTTILTTIEAKREPVSAPKTLSPREQLFDRMCDEKNYAITALKDEKQHQLFLTGSAKQISQDIRTLLENVKEPHLVAAFIFNDAELLRHYLADDEVFVKSHLISLCWKSVELAETVFHSKILSNILLSGPDTQATSDNIRMIAARDPKLAKLVFDTPHILKGLFRDTEHIQKNLMFIAENLALQIKKYQSRPGKKTEKHIRIRKEVITSCHHYSMACDTPTDSPDAVSYRR